jgi:hypothetical protein
MNKKVLIGAVAGLGVVACIAACAKSGKCQSDNEPKPTVDNIETTKANTDEILTLLKDEALTTTPAR